MHVLLTESGSLRGVSSYFLYEIEFASSGVMGDSLPVGASCPRAVETWRCRHIGMTPILTLDIARVVMQLPRAALTGTLGMAALFLLTPQVLVETLTFSASRAELSY